MKIAYEVRTHGLPGAHRWYVEVRPEVRQIEHPQQPVLGQFIQPDFEDCFVTAEAAERAGEAFLEILANCPPRV